MLQTQSVQSDVINKSALPNKISDEKTVVRDYVSLYVLKSGLSINYRLYTKYLAYMKCQMIKLCKMI